MFKFFVVVIISYILVLCFLLFNVNNMIFPYYLAKDITITPKNFNLNYHEVTINTSDNKKLYGWYVENNKDYKYILIYNHGNAENISKCLTHAYLISNKIKANLFLYDYRGYGKSEGNPSYNTFYEDCDKIFEYIKSNFQYNDLNIIVYGRSLGGAAAIHMASNYSIYKLITESTFASIPLHIWFHPILFIFYPFTMDYLPSFLKATKIKVPWLIIHGTNDKVIRVKNAYYLYNSELIQTKKELYIINNGEHNNLIDLEKEKYLDKIYNFIYNN